MMGSPNGPGGNNRGDQGGNNRGNQGGNSKPKPLSITCDVDYPSWECVTRHLDTDGDQMITGEEAYLGGVPMEVM